MDLSISDFICFKVYGLKCQCQEVNHALILSKIANVKITINAEISPSHTIGPHKNIHKMAL